MTGLRAFVNILKDNERVIKNADLNQPHRARHRRYRRSHSDYGHGTDHGSVSEAEMVQGVGG